MYLEIDLWVLIVLLMVLTLVSVFSFIVGIKEIKAYKEAHKPKKDKAQIILNKINDKIIDTQYQLDQMKDNQAKQYIKERLITFHYVKGMVEAVINDKEKERIK